MDHSLLEQHILFIPCALPSCNNFSDLNPNHGPACWPYNSTRRSDSNAAVSGVTSFPNSSAAHDRVASRLAFIANSLQRSLSTRRKPDNMPAITMVGAVTRSRVQFYGFDMKKKKDKTETNTHKQAKPATAAQKHYPDAKTTSTDAPVPADDTSKKVSTFSKKRVASTDEIAHIGHFQSELRATVARAGSTSACKSVNEDDPSDSPSASLVLTAPVYREVPGRLEQQSTEAPVTEQSPPEPQKDDSSSNWLTQVMVKLFAGRRRSKSKSNTSKRHTRSTSTIVPSIATTDQEEPSAHPYNQTECAPTPPPAVSLPKLTHRQVIPTVTRPQRKDPSHAPVYKDEPCAPQNRYTGYGVTVKDKFTPVTVQRGFNAPSSAPAPDALPSRRNQPASNLLDREGDVWARWHTRYPTPEDHPFTRSSSVAV